MTTTANNGGFMLKTYSKHDDEAKDKKLIKRIFREEEAKEAGQKKAMKK